MSRHILLTGEQGFIGSALMLFLKKRGYQVMGFGCDITDPDQTSLAIKAQNPSVLIHLAGMSHVPTCEKDPAIAWLTNVQGTLNLLKALQQYSPKTRLIFASTAQVYSKPEGDELTGEVIFTENRRLVPQNTYAATKLEAEMEIENAARTWGLSYTVLRLFNHTHKSQSDLFFMPHIYNALVQGRKDEPVRISIGNLDLWRDLGVIQDLLSAFEKAMDPTSNDVFNICSGTPRHLGSLARKLSVYLNVKAEFIIDPTKVRPSEPRWLCGSYQRFESRTGWKPQFKSDDEFLNAFLSEKTDVLAN